MTPDQVRLIEELRAQAFSWDAIGVAFGLSGDAIRKRYGRASGGRAGVKSVTPTYPTVLNLDGGTKILMLPDTQVEAGVPLGHFKAAGRYAAAKQVDAVVHIGDFGNFTSLSTYEDALGREGLRLSDDIGACEEALDLFEIGLDGYAPRKILTLGNHEARLDRYVGERPELKGSLALPDFAAYGWTVYPFLQPVCINGVYFCLEENHKVLTADLRYVPLKDVKVGDKLLAFDEESPGKTKTGKAKGRAYRTATVTRHVPTVAETVAVRFRSGKKFVCTPDHKFLVRRGTGYAWATAATLAVGTKVPRCFDEWETAQDRDAGWLAGFYDGEGCVSKVNEKQGGLQLAVSQNQNAALDEVLRCLGERGVAHELHDYRDCKIVRHSGPAAAKAAFLGAVRPKRLLENFAPEMLGRLQSIGDDEVESVNLAYGKERIVQMETSTGTFISEGYAHHNCHYFTRTAKGWAGKNPHPNAQTMTRREMVSCVAGHTPGLDPYIHPAGGAHGLIRGLIAGSFYQHDEAYQGPQGNRYWRGCVMLHDVRDGYFDQMEVSMRYLLSKYGD